MEAKAQRLSKKLAKKSAQRSTAPLEVCILAAGKGSRMCSDKPKVLQTLAGKPLIAHLLNAVAQLSPTRIHLVTGEDVTSENIASESITSENITRENKDKPNGVRSSVANLAACSINCPINWVLQKESLGTGHAVQQVAPHVDPGCRLLVLLGDVPLVRPDTLRGLLTLDADIAVLSVLMPDPTGYGRLVRQDGQEKNSQDKNSPEKNEQVMQIVEERDATDEQKAIKEVNTGVMAIDTQHLDAWLARLTDSNNQSEYLLTDIIEHACKAGGRVLAWQTDDPLEVAGVNTFAQLSELERAMQIENAHQLMEAGVQLLDPSRFDLRGRVKAGRNVCIDINVILEGDVELGDNVRLGPNVIIRDSVIGAGTEIRANTQVEESRVGADCILGPFARLRPGTQLDEGVRIGNFVEVKKSRLGKGSKANHLAYLGDAILGEDVNVGAGAITCNYDGTDKHETHIGDGAFIGSNASLIAPVNIGPGATIGAGSTITRDVEGQSLAVARGKQKVISNWRQSARQSVGAGKEESATASSAAISSKAASSKTVSSKAVSSKTVSSKRRGASKK